MPLGLDTNVLVRYFVRDDEAQWARARALIRSLTVDEPGFISLVTLAEVFWVMRGRYRLSKPELLKLLEMLLRTQAFILENAATVQQALQRYSAANADFADCLIERSAAAAGCAFTVTFDEKAVMASGMRLVG